MSAEENIKQLCFTEGAFLVKEFSRIFSDLFLRESKFYEKIIRSLSTGSKEQAEIQHEIGKDGHAGEQQYGRVPEYLWELQEAGFVRRDYSWNFKTGTDTKLSRYRLQDNYLRFYLKYIQKNLDKIKRDAFKFRSLSALPAWDSIMGFQFENLVLDNRKSIHELLSINPDEIINDNPFFQTKTKRNAACQIDYLIQTKFNSLYICEIKFSKNKIDAAVIHEVETKIKNLKFLKGFSCRPVLIHVNGVTDEVIERDYFSHIIDLG